MPAARRSLVRPGLRILHTEPATEPLVLRAARPLDPEATGLLHGDLVRLNLRRPIHVAEPAVPELFPIMPLTDVGELVEDVQVQDPLVPLLQVLEPRDDVPRPVADV